MTKWQREKYCEIIRNPCENWKKCIFHWKDESNLDSILPCLVDWKGIPPHQILQWTNTTWCIRDGGLWLLWVLIRAAMICLHVLNENKRLTLAILPSAVQSLLKSNQSCQWLYFYFNQFWRFNWTYTCMLSQGLKEICCSIVHLFCQLNSIPVPFW